MAEIVRLPARPAAEPSDHDLLVCALAELAALRAEVEALKPAPRFTIPANWLNVKNAAALCGYAEPTVSEWARELKVTYIKVGGRYYIDPASLPKRA
jgi:hypothetical protein